MTVIEIVKSPHLDYCILNTETGEFVCNEYLYTRIFHGYASACNFFRRQRLNQTVYRIVRKEK